MRLAARAPGKVVISGAYAVLSGAPAIVSAVDRYVTADAGRPAALVTPEVRAALGEQPPPWFDASELRENDRKLGLGSSAAILVASLAAVELTVRGRLSDEELRCAVFERALAAHAAAQGGGSGIDVAASAHGGTLVAIRHSTGLEIEPVVLPAEIVIEVWATTTPASTPELVGRVAALGARDASLHRRLLDAQSEAAGRAVEAVTRGTAAALVDALEAQREALDRLGAAANAPIVTEAVRELDRLAGRENAVVLPSGAGGGDIALFVGLRAPSPELSARASELGHAPLRVSLGARGVHALSLSTSP